MLLRGSFDISWKGASHRIGPRADVFSGYPHAVYLPARTPFRVVAQRRLRARRLPRAVRGKPSRRASSGPRTAATRFAAAATRRARSSTSCRRRSPPIGCCSARCSRPAATGRAIRRTSTTPIDPPREVKLEEIYYYRFEEPDGYGFQRVYTNRRDRHAARSTHGDVVAGARRISPVCYSLRIQRLLPERAGRHAPIDGGQRRSALRALSPRLAGARSAGAAGRAAGGGN